MSKYNLFIETNEQFIAAKVQNTHKELPSGAYKPYICVDTGRVIFNKIQLQSDDIVDLPSQEYEYVVNQMQHFLKEETKSKYNANGFVYKRSVLLHGKPGTGKTCIVSRVTKEALKNNAVVLFNPDPYDLPAFYEALTYTAPDKLTLVIFEEIDELIGNNQAEAQFLSILDGEIQKNNIIYLATTNFIERVPLRFQRPGRFSSIVEVGFPSLEARKVYLKTKKVEDYRINEWATVTEGFSIDELKETVLSVKCLDEHLEAVVKRINELKQRGLDSESKKAVKELTYSDIFENMLPMKLPKRGR